MASNNVFNKLKKKELTDDERNEMREKFADVSINIHILSISTCIRLWHLTFAIKNYILAPIRWCGLI